MVRGFGEPTPVWPVEMKLPTIVEEACAKTPLPKVWRAVQVFACPRAKEATTEPVVGEMVSVPSEFATEVTPLAGHEELQTLERQSEPNAPVVAKKLVVVAEVPVDVVKISPWETPFTKLGVIHWPVV